MKSPHRKCLEPSATSRTSLFDSCPMNTWIDNNEGGQVVNPRQKAVEGRHGRYLRRRACLTVRGQIVVPPPLRVKQSECVCPAAPYRPSRVAVIGPRDPQYCLFRFVAQHSSRAMLGLNRKGERAAGALCGCSSIPAADPS